MSRLRTTLPLASLALALTSGSFACRAKPAVCESLAEHIVEVAEAEGAAGPGAATMLQTECEKAPPTRELVECMMAAQTMAEISGC